MIYLFGVYRLNALTRQLLRGWEPVHITPKAFELLHLLIANRERAVSKAELQQRMWPSTFVVETNLATLVAEIRRALADDASSPRFIQTIYGFGYRFLEEVAEAHHSAGEPRPASLWLVFERRHIPLLSGENVIGRAADAAIQIDSPGMSRYHARVSVAGGEATLEDLGSKNGTLLNGRPITAPAVLADNDEIRLGAIALTVRISSAAGPTETVQP